MKFLMVHNEYGAPSGEEIQFAHIRDLLQQRGHQTRMFTRSSAEIPDMTLGNVRAFVAGIYNPSSRDGIIRALREFRPDFVVIKNLFPFISPSVLPACREAGVPVIMSVANYRLMCPNGLHMSHGKQCEKCLGGREYQCVLNNCEGNIFKSTGYALRSAVARVGGFYRKNVAAYICASNFLRERMIAAGFDAERLHLIPNVVPDVSHTPYPTLTDDGAYVGYVGRISKEKGVHVLLEAARLAPEVKFKLAGRVASDFALPDPLPPNVELVGFLVGEALAEFYARSRFFVSTS